MITALKHTIRRLRGQIIGWSIGLALYGLLMTYIYGTMFDTIDLVALMQNYPQEFMAFFGGMDRIGEPSGFLDLYFFGYMPVIVGIFAIGAGASLLVSHEEQGILDLILAHPISRSGLFWGRFPGLCLCHSHRPCRFLAELVDPCWCRGTGPALERATPSLSAPARSPAPLRSTVLVAQPALALRSPGQHAVRCTSGGQLPDSWTFQHERRPQSRRRVHASALRPGW